ncbi:eukaryotic_translation initiation factor 2B delta subunit [Hexamita inflata]|uniref:Translation initiation factor eIF2B subunit delta n=1 Tax=Hexamita inflata TaxID=28002 RepID=A0AA86N502_9EUKA|nr:eukaryotic translation initiation factor 2B delta subunit [Hexamita inflata]
MNIGNILEMDPFLDNCSSKQVQSKEINVTSCNAFQQDTDQDSQLPLLEDQKLVQGVLLQNQKIKQQSHLHTLLFGFCEPVTDSRVPMTTISKTAPPPFKFVVSYELKQWIDLLSDFRQSPSRVFEFFLFAFDAQVKVLGLTLDDLLFCSQNDVKNQPEIDESQVEVSESHQSETISTEKKDESGVEPEVSEPENGIHRSQTQVMMTKQTLDYKIIVAEYINKVHKYLISIVLSFYPQLPAQYENFEEQLNDFHQTVKVQRTMNQQHILQDYQKEFKQFIKSTINKTRQARNQIHRELGLWLTQGSNLLVFSPSQTITKSVLIACKLNPSIQLTLVDTKHKLAKSQLQLFIQHGIKCQYITLGHLPYLLQTQSFSKCITSAYNVSPNGNVLARSGANTLAILCQAFKIPFVVAVESMKFAKTETLVNNTTISNLVDQGDVEIDLINYKLINAIVCEVGIISPSSIGALQIQK